jgi:hypothetical protein
VAQEGECVLLERFDAGRVSANWWPADTIVLQPWRVLARVAAYLVGSSPASGRRIRVSNLSAGWVRCHEIQSAKHRDDR